MKGKHGVPMQSIEYAPKKKGNVRCKECDYLIFRTSGKKVDNKRDTNPNHWCMKKNTPRYYTAQCYCRYFKPKQSTETVTEQKVLNILTTRAQQTQTERNRKRLERKQKCAKYGNL